MTEEEIVQATYEQLPEAYQNLKWDGDDALPLGHMGDGGPTRDALIWLYRAACLAVDGMYSRKGS